MQVGIVHPASRIKSGRNEENSTCSLTPSSPSSSTNRCMNRFGSRAEYSLISRLKYVLPLPSSKISTSVETPAAFTSEYNDLWIGLDRFGCDSSCQQT